MKTKTERNSNNNLQKYQHKIAAKANEWEQTQKFSKFESSQTSFKIHFG